MNFNNIKIAAIAVLISLTAYNCSNDDDAMETSGPDFSGSYTQEDQMARPAINTVFVSTGNKDAFNATVPSNQGAAFQSAFQSKLLALNAGYTTNALGMDAATFTGALATDVLTVTLDGKTTFFDGTNVLTGRALADDVIDTELLLIFGGPMGADNGGVTSDNVDTNDKPFSTSFPYLAAPHQ
ncbi:uncharacterized protein DUF4331 [Gelidibacter algens]|jgi:hypothetical protein|uniref:Uncharacterized protein DUF4331 n=1 Tax=Gelidibacter algens TaxID=49280 RepID=A0A1A7R259_9FLAO|nr:DUF4331 family protein [Gelidibacter algens]OBX25588.1 hypothetical protein A9996_09100 [Gelidibacter algens]RAJ27872.1 uncharacterized protein DUF4331 [Gelidibacter algens]